MPNTALTDDHHLAFGRYIAAHTRLEHVLHYVIAGLMGVKVPLSTILTVDTQVRQKFDMALALIAYHGGDPAGPRALIRLVKLESLIEKGRAFGKLRNFIAHSLWKSGRKPGTIKPMWTSAKGTLKTLGQSRNEKNWTADEISKKASDIHDLCDEIALEMIHLGIFDKPSESDD